MGEKRISQLIMVWLLPLIVIGGFFIPLLGYLVLAMMIFLLALSYFRGRYWCGHLCPRGSFLDLGLRKISRRVKLPRLLRDKKFRWAIFWLFMTFFVFQAVTAEKTVPAIGFMFVRMCLLTTLIAIFLGIPWHERAWCAICPMGTLQGYLGEFRRRRRSS